MYPMKFIYVVKVQCRHQEIKNRFYYHLKIIFIIHVHTPALKNLLSFHSWAWFKLFRWVKKYNCTAEHDNSGIDTTVTLTPMHSNLGSSRIVRMPFLRWFAIKLYHRPRCSYSSKTKSVSAMVGVAILFPGVIFFKVFLIICSFMVVWCLEFWGWSHRMGFRGWCFQLMGFGAVVWGLLGFLGWGTWL